MPINNAIPDHELKADVDAYYAAGGNRTQAAQLRGMKRTTYLDRIRMAERRFGISLGRVADGRIEQLETERWELPPPGWVNRYIITSAQNNTHLHPGWINLLAYAEWLDDLPFSTCKFLVGTYSYALDAYGAKAVKRGTYRPPQSLWYAPEIREYICDKRVELAPGLVWCGEMNILPTAKLPLSGMESYNGRSSNIVPHARFALESVPSMPGEGTKLNFSTGTITQRNYIQKRVGIIAEQMHCYGGVIVEVDSGGDWYVRQLHIDGNGHVYDIGPAPMQPLRIVSGEVMHGARVVAVNWGDVHASEMSPWVFPVAWGGGGMLDTLRPAYQIMHDVFSMRSRTHHESRDFHAMYYKHAAKLESVEAEVKLTARFLRESSRDWCRTVIVESNHDRHLNRWLAEADPKKDLLNARYYTRLQAEMLDILEKGRRPGEILEFALRNAGAPDEVHYVGEDESFILCRDFDGGIECGLHGDRGPSGSRGSTANLARLGRAINKGHDHAATIRGHVYSAGVCADTMGYAHGPSVWSVSHIVTFENGRRQVITMWRNKWRA